MTRRVLLPLLLALALVGVSAPAHAAEEVGVSTDGRTWQPSVTRPLFDPGARWVPGEERTVTFWVRNQGPGDGAVSVDVETHDPDALARTGDVVLRARVDGRDWVRIDHDADPQRVGDLPIGRGEAQRVDVRAHFSWQSGNESQHDRVALDFRVTVAGVPGAGDGDDPGGPGGDPGGPAAAPHQAGGLPDTGNDIRAWMVWLAAALLGSGLALVAGRGRQEQG